MRGDQALSFTPDIPRRTLALREILAWLEARGYDFVTPTPSVCRRALEKGLSAGEPLRALLGWSQAVAPNLLDPTLIRLLEQADALAWEDGLCRSRLRVSRVAGLLFFHSAFPANGADAVFLGPDSYRFARFIHQASAGAAVNAIAEIGCGAGVGGLVAARLHPQASLELGDINNAALDLAATNAAHAAVVAQARRSDGMAGLAGPYDLIVANPPYVAGASGRLYKDGGDLHGARLALDWAGQAMSRLTPGGRFVLYTGSAILDGGVDALRLALRTLVARTDVSLSYEELDPDIFSGELRREAYGDVERIAAVGAVLQRDV